MVLHKYIFMPIWSVINHCQYGQLTDNFDWQASPNADWFICGQLRDDRRRK